MIPAESWANSANARRRLCNTALQLRKVTRNLRAGPILGIHKFSSQHALSINDVGLGNLLGAVKREDSPVLITNRKHVDMMLDQETMVDIRILVHAHRN